MEKPIQIHPWMMVQFAGIGAFVLFLLYEGFSHHRAANLACTAVDELVGDGEGGEPFWRTSEVMDRGLVAQLSGRYANTALRENPVVAKAMRQCRQEGFPTP